MNVAPVVPTGRTIKVPAGSDRFGRNGRFNYLGNALPVLSVRDRDGWQLDPYTDNAWRLTVRDGKIATLVAP